MTAGTELAALQAAQLAAVHFSGHPNLAAAISALAGTLSVTAGCDGENRQWDRVQRRALPSQ